MRRAAMSCKTLGTLLTLSVSGHPSTREKLFDLSSARIGRRNRGVKDGRQAHRGIKRGMRQTAGYAQVIVRIQRIHPPFDLNDRLTA